MKKTVICIFHLLLLAAVLQGQSMVARQDGISVSQHKNLQEAAVDGEAVPLVDDAMVAAVSQQELQSQLMNWADLGNLSLEQYLESFRLFIERCQPVYELQPYLVAECLWFQVVVLPQFQQVQQDGSLDKMMELNMESLPQVQQQVSDFLGQLEERIVVIHPWTDAVLTFFQELVQNPPMGLKGRLLEYGSLPELETLKDEHVFMPVEGSYRNALLYHGLMDFHQLVSQFEQAMGAGAISDTTVKGEAGDGTAVETDANARSIDGASAAEAGDAAGGKTQAAGVAELVLPPPVGDIDWSQVVSHQTLMYLLRHLPSGGKVYSYLLDYHTGETAASRCEDLYLKGCMLKSQWGFSLEAALPIFSASAIQAVEDDPFVLYCLPANDLERLAADLSCISTMAPVYFERTVSLLRRPASGDNPEMGNGGSL